MNFCSLRPSDPVTLHFLERIGEINGIKTIKQALCISSDAQEPLPHELAFDRMAAAYRKAIGYFIVGQHRPQFGAPVHHGIRQVGEAVIHQNLMLLLFGK